MQVVDAQFEKSAPALEDAPPPDLPEFCFVGRSNVGKSSALNALSRRRQLARVSKTPGRTRLLNFFRVSLVERPGASRRIVVRLCDLPGFGYAQAPKADVARWKQTVGDYVSKRAALVAVVFLVDAVVGPQPKDVETIDFLAAAGRTIIVVATKADRLSRARRSSALDRVAREMGVPRTAVLAFSATEKFGQDELWTAMCAAAGLFGRESERLLEPAPRQSPAKSFDAPENKRISQNGRRA